MKWVLKQIYPQPPLCCWHLLKIIKGARKKTLPKLCVVWISRFSKNSLNNKSTILKNSGISFPSSKHEMPHLLKWFCIELWLKTKISIRSKNSLMGHFRINRKSKKLSCTTFCLDWKEILIFVKKKQIYLLWKLFFQSIVSDNITNVTSDI